MYKYILLVVFTLFIQDAAAEEYLGRDLSSWPQNESRKVANDFGAWLLVTPDLDWQQKWDTPPDVVPHFNIAHEVRANEKLVILTFYTNPGVDVEGNAHVKCTITAERADGTKSIEKQSFDCENGKLAGNPRNIRLSPAVIIYTAEKDDPLGLWKIWVTLEDTVKQTTLSLQTGFTLVGEK